MTPKNVLGGRSIHPPPTHSDDCSYFDGKKLILDSMHLIAGIWSRESGNVANSYKMKKRKTYSNSIQEFGAISTLTLT